MRTGSDIQAHGSAEPWPIAPRDQVRGLEASRIREIANAGFGAQDILKFWFGESDQPTPDFIKASAAKALAADDVFYSHNNGRQDLRRALATYLGDLHGQAFSEQRITVTSSGVSALMLAMQAVVSPGDRVVVVTPVWPNVTQIPAILNAEVVRFGLSVREGAWTLDLDRLLETVTPKTRLLVINSPGNPTGWMLPAEAQRAILDHCRRLGVWILADDVYERLVFAEGLTCAPSFFDVSDAEDRLIGANSFSKAWLMTGWRLGWLAAPAALEADLGKLVEYNTSCAPGFIQAAALTAVQEGGGFVEGMRQDLKRKRDLLLTRLAGVEGVEAPRPEGGMYVFFRLRGRGDSVDLAKRLVAEARLGLAPGAAFGPEGEGWLRWCFAARSDALEEGAERLGRWIATAGRGAG